MFDHEKASKAFELANFAHKGQSRKDIKAPTSVTQLRLLRRCWSGVAMKISSWRRSYTM